MEINEKKLKGILEEQRKEYQEYLGALKEDFDSKVQLIVEQYESIRETLGSHTKTLNSHSEILNSHSEILNSHSEILNSHSEMIASMKEDMEIMKVDIAFIKNGMKKKVDVEEFEALEKRVAILEAKKGLALT